MLTVKEKIVPLNHFKIKLKLRITAQQKSPCKAIKRQTTERQKIIVIDQKIHLTKDLYPVSDI